MLAAVGFLTRIPIPARVGLDGEDVARAGVGFPIVGAGVGALVGALASGLAVPLTPLLSAGVAVAAGALVTGALHLDALADTADALGAGSRAKALEVMRDHAIGAYGACALGLDLLLRGAALAALAPRGETALRFATAAGALSRAAPVAIAATLPYARAAGGAGEALTRGNGGRAAVAAAVAAAIAVGAAGLDGLGLIALTALVAAAAAAGFRRWLGGVTGDALGATSELVELALLIAAVAIVRSR